MVPCYLFLTYELSAYSIMRLSCNMCKTQLYTSTKAWYIARCHKELAYSNRVDFDTKLLVYTLSDFVLSSMGLTRAFIQMLQFYPVQLDARLHSL